jgi:hypothetical protein
MEVVNNHGHKSVFQISLADMQFGSGSSLRVFELDFRASQTPARGWGGEEGRHILALPNQIQPSSPLPSIVLEAQNAIKDVTIQRFFA